MKLDRDKSAKNLTLYEYYLGKAIADMARMDTRLAVNDKIDAILKAQKALDLVETIFDKSTTASASG